MGTLGLTKTSADITGREEISLSCFPYIVRDLGTMHPSWLSKVCTQQKSPVNLGPNERHKFHREDTHDSRGSKWGSSRLHGIQGYKIRF
ncbi:hypothetical protein Pmani_034549 [Petrolisthes manimaculis]|uniref:Uncharacterized protein n=1 Tax=Petrolisthes manimaculis TaxID=1843537 RepID=A0AAE1TRE9_9EUCA|nr:hypothetical protein Pmani_034549 [Petrolisthes manimaculis]